MINLWEAIYSLYDCPILEMATIGKNIQLGKNKYRIEIHGPASKDRDVPHIHIYLSNDSHPWNKFNFEISLVDIIVNNEINLIRMKDVISKKNLTNRSKCSWDGYKKMYYDFEDWLYSDNVTIRGEYIDNLDALIYWFNEESNYDNALLMYIHDKGLKVHPDNFKYFSDEDKKQYKSCFI